MVWTPDDDQDDGEAPVDLAEWRRHRAMRAGGLDVDAWRQERAKRRQLVEDEKARELAADLDRDPIANPDDPRHKPARRGRIYPSELARVAQWRNWDAARDRYREAGERAAPWPDDGPTLPVDAAGDYPAPPPWIVD